MPTDGHGNCAPATSIAGSAIGFGGFHGDALDVISRRCRLKGGTVADQEI
jgi:hypothetical protein